MQDEFNLHWVNKTWELTKPLKGRKILSDHLVWKGSMAQQALSKDIKCVGWSKRFTRVKLLFTIRLPLVSLNQWPGNQYCLWELIVITRLNSLISLQFFSISHERDCLYVLNSLLVSWTIRLTIPNRVSSRQANRLDLFNGSWAKTVGQKPIWLSVLPINRPASKNQPANMLVEQTAKPASV